MLYSRISRELSLMKQVDQFEVEFVCNMNLATMWGGITIVPAILGSDLVGPFEVEYGVKITWKLC